MYLTIGATDLQGNPKDADLDRHIRTRIGYAVYSFYDGKLADSVDSLRQLVGRSLVLVDPKEVNVNIQTSSLKDVIEQEDGTVHLVTHNTVYVMKKEEA